MQAAVGPGEHGDRVWRIVCVFLLMQAFMDCGAEAEKGQREYTDCISLVRHLTRRKDALSAHTRARARTRT